MVGYCEKISKRIRTKDSALWILLIFFPHYSLSPMKVTPSVVSFFFFLLNHLFRARCYMVSDQVVYVFTCFHVFFHKFFFCCTDF
jgi:hypothetical protein